MNAQRSIRLGYVSMLTLAAVVTASAESRAQATKVPVGSRVQEKAKAKTTTVAAPIDVNSATHAELMELPGVGEAMSKKIVDGRPYKTVDDLTTAGVPAATVAKIKPLAIARALPAAVDVNTATVGQLETLPGVGPAMARAIMEARPYNKFDDLGRVKGLGEAKLAALRGRVSFAKAPIPTATEKAKAKAAVATETVKTKGAAAAETVKTKAGEMKAKAVTAKETVKEKIEASKSKVPPGKKINLNTASKDDLQLLWGIGPVHAQAIIDARPFTTIDDVMKVKGIKEVEFGKIKDEISVK